MRRSEKRPEVLGRALSVLRFDASERLEALREEVQHLINSIRYRIDSFADFSTSPNTGVHVVDSDPRSSQKAFLMRLGRSAQSLMDECRADIDEVKLLSSESEVLLAKSRATEHAHDALMDRYSFDLLWHAKVVKKATVVAERLGDLHDRLEQFLQRTNPDHPDPLLRRRCEHGLTDKYLSELSRWVHKDLACFLGKLSASYPYRAVPSTFHYWTYENSCRHHSFSTLESHIRWCDSRESVLHGRRPEQIEPDKFVSIAMSYWVPERLSLVPIIGHEIAHQLLRDIYGREANFALIEEDDSSLGRVYRRLTSCTEAWLAVRFANESRLVSTASRLVQEILCDMIAATRFGYAYLYAWMLELLADERFAQLFHNRYGMIRRAVDGRVSLGEQTQSMMGSGVGTYGTSEVLREDAILSMKTLRRDIIDFYYRGKVLVRFLQQVGRETDFIAAEFGASMDELLRAVLDIYVQDDGGRASYEDQFAADLAKAVCDESIDDDAGSRLGDSDFVHEARAFWGFHNDRDGRRRHRQPTLERQLVTGDYRALVDELFEGRNPAVPAANEAAWYEKLFMKQDKSRSGLVPETVGTLSDIIWRTEWAIHSRGLPQAQRVCGDGFQFGTKVQALIYFGMDDYLYRTATPARLFSVVSDRSQRADILRTSQRRTNSVKQDDIQEAYDDSPVIELDRQIARWKAGLLPDGQTEVQIQLSDSVAAKIPVSNFAWLREGVAGKGWQRGLLCGDEPGAKTPPMLLLELHQLRSSKHLLSRVGMASSNLGAKYVDSLSGGLLGRYDAYSVSRQQGREGIIDRQALNRGAEVAATAYVSRTKRLVPVGGLADFSEVRSEQLVAIVLVSLKWDASRTLFARWLCGASALAGISNARVFTFLSDGWEDVVLFVVSKESPESAVAECFEVLKRVSGNPFVSNTETLFSTHILRSLPDYMGVHFSCRAGDEGFSEARVLMDDMARDLKLDICAVAGNRDFDIRVLPSSPYCISEIHAALHRDLPEGCRLETQVRWRLAVSSGASAERLSIES